MLAVYNYFESFTHLGNDPHWYYEKEMNYSAWEIMQELEISHEDMSRAIERVFHACTSLHIPFERNFKPFYRSDGEQVFKDWKLSALGCYLVVINCDPINEQVARAQLYFMINAGKN
jgi:hypothetical protein